jgi:hypothetical protein
MSLGMLVIAVMLLMRVIHNEAIDVDGTQEQNDPPI